MQIARPIYRFGWWIIVAVALVALVLMPAEASVGAASSAADPGGVGIRLLDAPADASSDPRAQLYIVDHLSPGLVVTRRIEVSNSTREPLSVALYIAGAEIVGGQFAGLSGNTANELSTWSTVLPSEVSLPAGERATGTVRVSVPPDAESGERYAAVWAEVRAGSESGVVQVNRVGIRLYVSVGSGAAPAADFTIDSMTAERSADGLPMVVAMVTNNGGRALDMAGTLELLAGPGGLQAGPFPATLGSTLAIGSTGQVLIALDERVPDGPWDAELTLRSGLLERSAKASITFPTSGSAPPEPAAPAQPRWLFFALAGIVLGLLLALIVSLLRRRRGIERG